MHRNPLPPYVIPSMAQIRALPKNGYTVASTFSGCGGSALGYKLAGFDVVWANEFIPAAQETYRANHPDTLLDPRDIRVVTGADILRASAGRSIDILDGSPPCAAFSTAGRRAATWGEQRAYSDTVQRVDDLFDEYIRVLGELRPRVFIAENVSGLVKGVSKGMFMTMLSQMERAGYRVAAKTLRADWLGVPQMRERLFFMGIRDDVAVDHLWPAPASYRYTVRDVLPHIVRVKCGGRPNLWRDADTQPSPTIAASDAEAAESGYLSGRGYVEARTPDGRYVRRQWTIDELKVICSFPADFILTGTYPQQWERLGRAVPPFVMQQISQGVLTMLRKADT